MVPVVIDIGRFIQAGDKYVIRFTRAMTAGFLAIAGFVPAAVAAPDNPIEQDLRPCFINGLKDRAECLALDVPLDYADPGGRQISIHAAVVRASGSAPEADPIWVFAGGPGEAAAEYGALVRSVFSRVHKSRDIVLVDQRGTGKSNGLRCDVEPGRIVETLEEWTDIVRDCREAAGIDVRHFTMENVIRDMEAVRARLGYERLNVWGGSWGTRTTALYLKRHPDRVRSIIVDGTAPPDLSLFETAPTSADRALRLLIADCAADAACAETYPNFEAQVAAYLAKADAGTLRYIGNDPVTGDAVDLPITFVAAVESIRSVMYSADATVMLPFMINEADKGNLAPLAALMAGSATLSSGMYVGATLSIICGEEIPRVNEARLQAAAAESFARDSYYTYWKASCDGWQALPPAADAHDPIASEVPALILSGDLDPVTPPSMGEHWVNTFPNGRHIVTPGNGHITSRTACMPRLLAEFVNDLDVGALDATCLDHLKRLPVITGLNGTVN